MVNKEYQSNSHRSKELAADTTREKKEKVVSGKVSTKPNKKRNLASIFVSEDITNVKSYVLMEVLVPTIKKTISEIVTNSVDMILYGETRGSHKRSSSGNISYRKYYDDKRSDYRDRRESPKANVRFDCEDIEFDSRGDAEMVKRRMLETSEEYGMVTVADMYDFAGLTVPFTAQNYGWMGLRNIDVHRGRDGYYLKLPKAMPIE